jgi:ceramide glucosyltransferase
LPGYIVSIVTAIAAGYQIVAIAAALAHRRKSRQAVPTVVTPVSILKPVRGVEPGFEDAIRANASQSYPDFEVLFGVTQGDPAEPVIQQISREFPAARIGLVRVSTITPNRKVGALIDLARQAMGDIIVIADADVIPPPLYLRQIAGLLANASTGLVTCVYRARSRSRAGSFEALGVSTDFAPGAMVAPFAGVDEFALGATMALRRADLERIGGFESIADYLADDYQLGHRIRQLGLRCVLSDVIVETSLNPASWSAVWRHQLRWARTIRVSRPGGYAGLPVANATLWAVFAACAGRWWIAAGLLVLRLTMALIAGWMVLGDQAVPKLLWLVPARDLFGAAVWAAGLFGHTVEWGGSKLRLTRDGRIVL